MKRKIFISINIPEKARRKLVAATQKWQDLPMKWVPEANLHITLLFLGYVDEETLPDICRKVEIVSQKGDIFDIEFDRIELFPSKEQPRMIALTGPASDNLLKLFTALEKELDIFISAKKAFRPHITLGRGRKYKWEALQNKPSISEKYPLVITAQSLDVMASYAKEGERAYVVIESCRLK